MRVVAAALLCVALLLPTQSRAEDPAEACDRLAADAVAAEAIDAVAASAACATALEGEPAEARFAYQYARALERAGRLEDARRLYGWAATDGFAPAVAALQRLAAIGPAAPDDRTDSVALLTGLSAALDRYQAGLPGDPTDPLTVLAAIGREPSAIFDWVVQNTRLVAYRGELRGASGVLLDRSGNSLDRSLLLATLLRLAGQEVRLGHATLAEPQARALLPATARNIGVPALPPSSAGDAAAFFATDPRFDPAMLQQAATQATSDAERTTALLAPRRALLVPALDGFVGHLAADADPAAEADAVAALADHYWVQLRTADGWRDLDPDGEMLGTLVPLETLAPDAVPDAERHGVAVRVILELQDAAGRHEETLLAWQGHPDALIDQPITFSHVPRGLSEMDLDPLLAPAGRGARMLAALDSEQAWMPVLQVGRDAVIDKLFDRDGAISTADANVFAGTGGQIGDLFEEAGTLLSGGDVATADPAIPTAEWLELEIQVPGAAPVVQRRTVFDLVGPAARAAGTVVTPTSAQLRERAALLLGQTQILITGATPSSVQVERLASRDLAAIAERLAQVRSAPEPVDLDALTYTATPPLLLYDFASRRLAAGGAAAAGSPTVVLQNFGVGLGSDDALRSRVELDIVRNEVTVPAGHASFLARLDQGVLDTILEALPFDGMPGARNAATFHAEDLAAGRPWTPVEAGDISRLAAPGVPADDRARIEADLGAGFVVVAPADLAAAAAANRLAWWRIDPRTGTTLGMLDDGAGAAMIEYTEIINAVTPAFCAFFAVGAIIGDGAASTAAAGLAVCAAGGLLGLVEAVAIPGLFIGSGIGVSSLGVYILRFGL